jgi:hypothetical protein
MKITVDSDPLACGCPPYLLFPAREGPDHVWEPVASVVEWESTGVTTVVTFTPPGTWRRERKYHHVDGVRLFCVHGEVVPK